MSEKKQIAINMMAQFISFVINVSINFFLTPYVTAKVGTDVYGFVNLAFQTTGYITLLTTALNAMVGRYITISLARKEYENAKSYLSSVIVANGVVAMVMVLPTAFFISNLEQIIQVPAQHIFDIKLLWVFIFINFFITLVTQFYGLSMYATNRLDLGSKRTMQSNILRGLLTAGLFLFFIPKLWFIGFVNLICGIFIIITNMYYAKKLTPELTFSKALVRIKVIKELISVGIWNTVQQLSTLLISGCDMLITNLFISASSMTLMGYAKTMPLYLMQFIGIAVNSFTPQMTILYGKGDMDGFINQVKSAIKVSGFLCSVPILGFIVFGYNFFDLWLYALNDKEVLTVQILSILILAQTVFDVYVYPLYSVMTITCKLKVPVFVSLGIGIANIIGSIVLCTTTNLGVYAVQIVSSVLLTAQVLFFTPIYAAHILGKPWGTFYKPLFRGMISSSIMLTLFYGYHTFVSTNSWPRLFLAAAICGIIGYGVNYIILLDRLERIMVKDMIVKKLKLGMK